MPAHRFDVEDGRYQRWNGITQRKFAQESIRVLPSRLARLDTALQAVHALIDLISGDQLAADYWEAL
jgi:hypothetical protein